MGLGKDKDLRDVIYKDLETIEDVAECRKLKRVNKFVLISTPSAENKKEING